MQHIVQDGKYHQVDFGFNKKEEKPKKIDFEYQALGVEMQQHFGNKLSSRIWPLFWNAKYTVPRIREAWVLYQKNHTGKGFNYFLGILKNL